MAQDTPVTTPWSLILPTNVGDQLMAHLFPGDHDEHGGILTAGIAQTDRGTRLLARDFFPALDGIDYVPGQRGYRMLRANFITERIRYCRDEQLCYLAVHNHGGTTSVDFSPDDMASHERGYPALLEITRGKPVGGLVFAQSAAAGDIWLSQHSRTRLQEVRFVGSTITHLYPAPPARPRSSDEMYDRPARLFGDKGQDLLSRAKVGIIGAGGVGSLLVEYLSRLGVGWIVVVDPQRMHLTNVPRIPGSTHWDAWSWLTRRDRPRWLREIGARLATRKVALMRRLIRQANQATRVEAICGDFVNEDVARHFTDCDYLFLAADSMQARLVFNALVYQYLIPGVQVGSKVRIDSRSGNILDVYSVSRPVVPDSGCLWCNGLIPPARLQAESSSPDERMGQAYVEDDTVFAPSVITLNATAASQAANNFLFAWTGLVLPAATTGYMRFRPQQREVLFETPRRDVACPECGTHPQSRLARGDARQLPTRSFPSISRKGKG